MGTMRLEMMMSFQGAKWTRAQGAMIGKCIKVRSGWVRKDQFSMFDFPDEH